MTAAIAAWSVYGPTCGRRARSTSAAPSATAWSHSERSWSSSRIRSPVGGPRGGGLLQQHQRQQPDRLRLGRSSTSSRPRRIASSQVGGVSASPDDGAVALVEHQVDHLQDGVQPLRQILGDGTW